MKRKIFQHSCGGWYIAWEDDDGFHRAPPSYCCSGCFDTGAEALDALERMEDEEYDEDEDEDR